MSADATPTTDVAFSPAVKAVQERLGSRKAYARVEAKGGWASEITDDLAAFLAQVDSAYFATASADGQPYIQHRGGPKGFLVPLDERTIAFADFAGNRQYISVGNLSENNRAQLFLMDYTQRQRIKIWGEAEVSEDAALIDRLMPAGYKARPERAIVFRITAWDINCPQHIPQKFGEEVIQAALEKAVAQAQEPLLARIAELEQQLAQRSAPA
ncbi:MAG: pyridoxamine 5'-phosphate oxidase family protein [Alphaproteobacteria bacterium]|nr:pyridoxamine 5'-phosphate oxidase family protein [Alphaproteobacteria bacterium]